MKKIFLILIAIIILGTIFFLTNKPQTAVDKNKIQVVTSFYPLYFFASEIAGDKAQITNLTPSGVEPHDYEPTPQNIVKIQNSKLLLVNGAGLEPWVDKLQNELTTKGVSIITVSEEVALLEGQPEEDEKQAGEEEIKDPHVWLNPVMAKQQAAKILQGLIAVDPTNRSSYETKAEELNKKLGELDQKYRNGLSECQQNNFVTSHAAFAYLAKEYNLTMTPIAGLSPENEPSPGELAEVANFAKENNVKYIFFETLVSPKLSETIAQEIGAKTMVLDPIEGISDDDISKGENYFTIMEDNLKNLQEALQCSK